jgi:hypothetical protein
MTRFLERIKNPKTPYMIHWYLDKIHWTNAMMDQLPIEERLDYNTEENKLSERVVRNEAVNDMYTYIISSPKSRTFVIHLDEMENSDNYFVCKFIEGTWWLLRPKETSVKLYIPANTLIKRYRLVKVNTLSMIYLSAKATDNIYVIGFKFYGSRVE